MKLEPIETPAGGGVQVHEIRDTGDDHWMTGWPRWACSCGATGASRVVPTACPYATHSARRELEGT
jgi:hypothetical protein